MDERQNDAPGILDRDRIAIRHDVVIRQVTVEKSVPRPAGQLPRIAVRRRNFLPATPRREGPGELLARGRELRKHLPRDAVHDDAFLAATLLRQELAEPGQSEEIAEASFERRHEMLEGFVGKAFLLGQAGQREARRRSERRVVARDELQPLPGLLPAAEGPKTEPEIQLGPRRGTECDRLLVLQHPHRARTPQAGDLAETEVGRLEDDRLLAVVHDVEIQLLRRIAVAEGQHRVRLQHASGLVLLE